MRLVLSNRIFIGGLVGALCACGDGGEATTDGFSSSAGATSTGTGAAAAAGANSSGNAQGGSGGAINSGKQNGGAASNPGGAASTAGGAANTAGGAANTAGSAANTAGGADNNAGGADSTAGGADNTAGGADNNAGGADNTAGGVDNNAGGKPADTGGKPLTINDKAPGWASMNGGTIGGGTDLSKAIKVSDMSGLQSAITGGNIVLVSPGTYKGNLEPGANTTIIGTAPGVDLKGHIRISGSGKKNIIVRNISVQDDHCGGGCSSGSDAVYIGSDASNVWFDHVDVMDGQDGNFDVTRGGDFVTCSWCRFRYTYDKDHSLSNLIAGSDGETDSRGKLKITYMNSWFGERIRSRQPRGRFGQVHMLNNYHKNEGSLHGVGKEMSLIAENCYYDVPGKPVFFSMGSPKGWKGTGNEGSAKGLNDSNGSTFEIPYQYGKMTAQEAKAAVTSTSCGAGNTCTFQM